ncbi:MAG: type II toxin-antitoxin system RelE/ParE family toxin [Proteobacteria bacterium]|nr:type II toxin-antitoxin system RelE/ParE family toxin [Pseudomonadota bacterium]
MTSQDSLDLREVIFINERCRVDYEAMPAEVRESADQAIDALQNARPLPPKLYKSLGGALTGVDEIRLGYDCNTYRVYVTLPCPWVIMVLDAGMKKSTEGKNIPKWHKERLQTRRERARKYCTDYDADLKTDFNKRKTRRDEFGEGNGP